MQNKYKQLLAKLARYSMFGVLVQCVVIASAFGSRLQQQQDITVTGSVTGVGDEGGLPGVNVVVKGTTTGTSTDSEGRYTIRVPENATLVFSFIGYTTQEIPVAPRTGGVD